MNRRDRKAQRVNYGQLRGLLLSNNQFQLYGSFIRMLIVCFIMMLPVLISVSECLSATIKGKIVSDRIEQFSNFVVHIEYVDSELFTVSKKAVTSIQRNNQIVPKVLPIVSSKEIIFSNQDPHFHNIHTDTEGPVSFNIGIPANTKYGPIKFSEEGEIMLLCDIHPEIKGYILVLQNPFFSNVDEKGNFIITKVPKGEFELVTWHNEFISKKQKVIIKDAKQSKLVQFIY